MAITRITVPNGLPEPTAPVKPERGFTICLHLRQQTETCRWGTWVDGKFLPIRYWERGGVGVYDLEANPIAVRPTGFDSVHFNLPRRTLDAFTDDNELHRIGDLPCTQGIKNDVLLQLTKFALPWLGDERRVSQLDVRLFRVDVLQPYRCFVWAGRTYEDHPSGWAGALAEAPPDGIDRQQLGW